MYHCHVRLYLVGRENQIFEMMRGIPPLEHFTYSFSQSEWPEASLAAEADVILAHLEGADAKQRLLALSQNKRGDAELILLATQEQLRLLAEDLSGVTDIWTMPVTEAEGRFRIQRWQQMCKMQKDCWETSHFFSTIVDSTPNLVWFKDKDGVHHLVNDSFCKSVGKTKEQVKGRRHAYIWDVEQDDPACIESERIVMEKRQTCISEETIMTGEGLRLLTTYKSPLYDLDGSVMGTVGVAIDVTQEQAYKQEVIQKNRTLETIFSTIDCGLMLHTLDGTEVIDINRAALKILGYASKKEMMADGFHWIAQTVMDEDKEMLRNAIQSLQNEGDSVSLEYRVQYQNGEIREVTGNIKLIRENDRLLYQRFLLDCTDRKLKERQERMEQEQRYLELVHALSIDYSLVCSFSLDTGIGRAVRIGQCSQGVLQSIFDGELLLADCMGQYITSCVYSEDRDLLRQAVSQENLKKQLTESSSDYINYRTICSGETKYFQMKIVRAGTWEENHDVVLGFRSVDEETRRDMEKKGLLEDALNQANRANQAKSVFLSNMSHDIRTPMNAIVGFTALALTHLDKKEQVGEYLKKIMSSGNHLLSLINDILDMSRIESGRMHLEETLCSLPDILHGLRNIVQADINAKQLDLYMDAVDIWDEDIYCDKLRLNQVLLNLLSNSVKYTCAGGTVCIRVTETPGALPGFADYEFHIKDTGIGMSEEFVGHIFEPFERERNTTISGIQGTGLGMAITKNIVDMMNGSITVKSKQGVGTEFIVNFTFRLHDGNKTPKDIPELKNCRALVVDDDFNTCDSVSYMLQQIGMRAEWTLSGREAVLRTRQAVARNDGYCVYIIDWLLPDMNGVEVARRIRKETGENVPIIVLTAYDWSDIEDEAREAGVSAFCSKPLFMSELRSCLFSVVGADRDNQECVEEQPQLRSGRILLTEDNELNQEIAQAILEEAGFTVEIADNGQIALDMLSASQPGYYQLILMDVQMPVMDGYEAARRVRAMENRELAEIPIIAMTANAFEEDRREALKNGMNGHIAKPLDVKVLFDVLDQILNNVYPPAQKSEDV